MKSIIIQKTIGGIAAVLGICWIGAMALPLYRLNWDFNSDFSFVLLLMLIPGILAVVYGIRLFRTMSVESVKWLIGIFVFLGVFWSLTTLKNIFPDFLPQRIASGATFFAASFITLPLYVAVLKYILPHLGYRWSGASDVIGRGTLIFISWTLWSLLFTAFHQYALMKESAGELWVLAIPILISYVFYRMMAFFLLKKTQDERMQTTGAGSEPES